MRRLCIDTSIYVAFKGNNPAVIEALRLPDVIGVDIAVIAELFAGFALGNREAKNRRELEAFLNAPRVEVLTHDLETAEFYSLIVKKLKTKGKPIPSNDIWIAANTLKHGMGLFSFDRHFEEIDGLLLFRKARSLRK
jgi:predicted nucleic acid-binding protein